MPCSLLPRHFSFRHAAIAAATPPLLADYARAAMPPFLIDISPLFSLAMPLRHSIAMMPFSFRYAFISPCRH
jgi:hypothetical protein